MDTVQALLPYITIANFLLTWGLGFAIWLVRKNIATDQRVTTVEGHLIDKYEEHDNRLQHIETTLETAPTHKDLAAIYTRIDGLAREVNVLIGESHTQTDLLRTLVNKHIQ